jgi:hypothetical protein
MWRCGKDRHRRILRTFGLLGKTRVTSLGVERGELLESLTSFVAFLCDHMSIIPEVRWICEDRVRTWYGGVVLFLTREQMLRSERMLHILQRATGTRDFLILSDVHLALFARIGDAVLCVYRAYLADVADVRSAQESSVAHMV